MRGIFRPLLFAAVFLVSSKFPIASGDDEIRPFFSAAPEEEAEAGIRHTEALAASLISGEYGGRAGYEAAVVQLRRRGSDTLTPFVAVLADTSQALADRQRAARVLGDLGQQDAFPALLAAMGANNLRLSRAAAAALVKLAPHDHALELCRFMLEVAPSDTEIRCAVYEALGTARNPEALPFLMQAQATEMYPDCRTLAARAVDAIIGQELRSTRQAQMRWIRQNRPEWMRYFEEQVQIKTHPGYTKIILYFVGGVVLAIVGVWYLWTYV